MRYIIPIILQLIFLPLLPAQPGIEWERAFGGSDLEVAQSVQQTSDGGYIVAGYTRSTDGQVTGNHGAYDCWVLKLSAFGDIEWKRAYGGTNNEWAYAVRQTRDGGYVIAGKSMSNNGDVSGNHGKEDAWVLKLDSGGAIEWQRSLGGSGWDAAYALDITTDGGYVIAGLSDSNDGDVTGNHGATDFWVLKLDEDGAIIWQRSLGGSHYEWANAVRQTPDGGYIVVGESLSSNGDVTNPRGDADYWVVKLDSLGTLEWQRSLGSTSIDSAFDVCPTDDGGYVVAGIISFNSGDVTEHRGWYDIWVVKLDFLGKLIWQKTLGGSGNDTAVAVQQTADGGLAIGGSTASVDGDAVGNDGGLDFWLVKITKDGSFEWQKSLGGTKADRAFSMQQTADGGFVMAGRSSSDNGDVSFNHGDVDYWVVKLSPESASGTQSPLGALPLDISPNPARQRVRITAPTEEGPLDVAVYDLLGRELLRVSTRGREALDVSGIPPGTYMVVATAAKGQVFVGRLLRE